MSIEAVVFDVGNVLIEWDRDRLFVPLIPDDSRREDFYASVLTMEVNLALDAGAPFEATLRELAAEHPSFRDEILAFDSRWGETFGPQDDAMVELVGELIAADVAVFGLTNFSAEKWPIALDRHRWLANFSGVVVSGQEGVVKPTRAIYDLLLGRYGLRPGATWFTDDSQSNVDGGREAGLVTSLFRDAATTRAELVSLGVIRISSCN